MGSYSAGSEAGTLYYISGDIFVGKDCTARERVDVASYIAQRADRLLLL